jgi:hypothetical protein
MNCPKCGSENVSIERRVDGMKTCLDCGYKWRNVAQAGHVVTSCHEDRTYKGDEIVIRTKADNYRWVYKIAVVDDDGRVAIDPCVMFEEMKD